MSFCENGASNAIPKFDCHSDPGTLVPRWKRWLTSFELFADGKGLIITETTNANTRQRRRAMLSTPFSRPRCTRNLLYSCGYWRSNRLRRRCNSIEWIFSSQSQCSFRLPEISPTPAKRRRDRFAVCYSIKKRRKGVQFWWRL